MLGKAPSFKGIHYRALQRALPDIHQPALPALRSLPDIHQSLPDIHQHRHYRTSINWLLPEVIGIASTALPDIHRLVITGGYGHYRMVITGHPSAAGRSTALPGIH
jgi:hypothetical protein